MVEWPSDQKIVFNLWNTSHSLYESQLYWHPFVRAVSFCSPSQGNYVGRLVRSLGSCFYPRFICCFTLFFGVKEIKTVLTASHYLMDLIFKWMQ